MEEQLGRHDAEVEGMRRAKGEGERAAQAKLDALKAGFDAQLAQLTRRQEETAADKDATEEERQKLAAQVQQLERERQRQVRAAGSSRHSILFTHA